jgi:hypothetical protein
VEENTVVNVAIDGIVQEAQPDELLLDLISHFPSAAEAATESSRVVRATWQDRFS